MKKIFFLILGLLIIGISSVFQTSSKFEVQRETGKVVRVVDGDTIEVLLDPSTSSGQASLKIRYIGIDTPESVDPRKEVQCFAKEATAKNKELVEGKEVELEKDVSETDKFGRLLRYVYVVDTVSQPRNDTGSSGQIFVNEELVRQGFAHSSTFPPDVKYQEVLRLAQDEARANNRGLWGSCR